MLNASLKRAMRDCKSRVTSWFIQHRDRLADTGVGAEQPMGTCLPD
jgi:hypothetical protein